MITDSVLLTTDSSQVVCPAEVERIAQFVATWGRKSEANPGGCTHPEDQMCEQYGCSSFEELAEAIRRTFGGQAAPKP